MYLKHYSHVHDDSFVRRSANQIARRPIGGRVQLNFQPISALRTVGLGVARFQHFADDGRLVADHLFDGPTAFHYMGNL